MVSTVSLCSSPPALAQLRGVRLPSRSARPALGRAPPRGGTAAALPPGARATPFELTFPARGLENLEYSDYIYFLKDRVATAWNLPVDAIVGGSESSTSDAAAWKVWTPGQDLVGSVDVPWLECHVIKGVPDVYVFMWLALGVGAASQLRHVDFKQMMNNYRLGETPDLGAASSKVADQAVTARTNVNVFIGTIQEDVRKARAERRIEEQILIADMVATIFEEEAKLIQLKKDRARMQSALAKLSARDEFIGSLGIGSGVEGRSYNI